MVRCYGEPGAKTRTTPDNINNNKGDDDDVLFLEVHGQHPISFVHDQVPNRAKRETLGILEVINHTPRRGDDDVRLACQRDALLHDVHTTDNDRALHTDRRPQCSKLLPNLECKLARGGENEARLARTKCQRY